MCGQTVLIRKNLADFRNFPLSCTDLYVCCFTLPICSDHVIVCRHYAVSRDSLYANRTAALPSVVSASNLLKANTVNFNVITIARIGGTAAAGILVSFMNLYTVYALSLVFYVILVLLITQLKFTNITDSSVVKKKEKIRFSELFPLIRQEPAILIALINSGIITLFLGGFNLLVLKFSQVQHKPELMGWIYSIEGTSILVVGLLQNV